MKILQMLRLICCWHLVALASPSFAGDSDKDGLDDAEEEILAEQYAPIVFHHAEEPSLQTNVDFFLKDTRLLFHDESTPAQNPQVIADDLDQGTLISKAFVRQGDGKEFRSDRIRSLNKKVGFFLEDVPEARRKGSINPAEWTTYTHVYPTESGGVAVQYWRFYAYNSGLRKNVPLELPLFGGLVIFKVDVPVEVGNHGGDWEGVQVVLNHTRDPVSLRLLGHKGIQTIPWHALEPKALEGEHVRIRAEIGGHASTLMEFGDAGFYRHDTRTGGGVVKPDGSTVTGGGIVNVGERSNPMNSQGFVKYAGLWGTPSRSTQIIAEELARRLQGIPAAVDLRKLTEKLAGEIAAAIPELAYINSAYWGPAYNETEAERQPNGLFIKAWGFDYRKKPKEHFWKECFPAEESE